MRRPRTGTRRDSSRSSILERERQASDEWAARIDPRSGPRSPDEWPHEFERAILERLQDAPVSARVLELGCGDGELTFQLVDAGMRVTALDITPSLVEVARSRLARHRPHASVDFLVAPAEATGLESGSFDFVVGKWVLHHLALDDAAAELRRLLRPGGTGVFVETSLLNPLLAVARRSLPGRLGIKRWGTPDEQPIRKEDIRGLREFFPDLEVDFPNFLLAQLLGLHYRDGTSPRLRRACEAADLALVRAFPRLRASSYYLRLTFTKAAPG